MNLRPLLLCLLIAPTYAPAQSIQLTPATPPVQWLIGAKNAGDERLYLIRQDGYIVIRTPDGQVLQTPFLDWSTHIKLAGEQGLLGLAFHPNYASNGKFFIFYSRASTGESVLSRLTVSANDPLQADPNSEEVLLTFPHPNPNHVGGALEFGPDGYLYLSSGDGGEFEDPNNNGQNNQHFLGKILRIDINQGAPYAIPTDNPFVGNSNYLPEIWATGLRNPWRITFDRLKGDLWIGDVGEKTWEEVNLMPAGVGGYNFGWSCLEGPNTNFHPCPDTLQTMLPLYYYEHNTNPNCSGSVTGGYVYRGTHNGALWGKYIFGDFCTGEILYLEKTDNSAIIGSLGTFNPFDYVSFAEDNTGELYIAGYFSNKLYQISSTDCKPVAQIVGPTKIAFCPGEPINVHYEAYGSAYSGMQFQWQKDGQNIAGADSAVFNAEAPGLYRLVVNNPANACTAVSDSVEIQLLPISSSTLQSTVVIGSEVAGVLIEHDTVFNRYLKAVNGCDSTITYQVFAVSSTKQPFESQISDFQILPNPARDKAELRFFLKKAVQQAHVSVFDVQGRLIFERTITELASGAQNIAIQTDQWPDGIYSLQLYTENGTVWGRLARYRP